MPDTPDIPTAIRQLPLFANRRIISCDLLPEGRTNHNYRVEASDQVFFVRLSAADPTGHGIDRRREYASITTLYKAGIGPAPVYFDPAAQIIVTEFIDAPTWELDQLKTPDNLALFGRAIAALHALDDGGAVYDIAVVTRDYTDNLRGSDVVSATDLDFLEQICLQVEDLSDADDMGMCHNDLWCGNCLADAGVKFVDLEMAGRGDIYFDLICFVHFHKLDDKQIHTFTNAYAAAGKAGVSLEKLERMRTALRLRECLWAFTQIKNGFTGAFYRDCCSHHLQALRQARASI